MMRAVSREGRHTRRYYDDYDYEQAYKKQCDALEEWELERMLQDGEVACLYRTTTTKAENIRSGTVLLESQVYPSFKDKRDMPVTEERKKTRQSQKDLNDKNARRHLIRLANINFGEGDIWGTFGWDDESLPEDEERAGKDITNFIKRINRRRKKSKLDNTKYIYILAFVDYERPHFHILLSGEGMDRDEIEGLWKKCKRPNTKRIKPDDDFIITGLATYISQNPHGKKRWCSSKNLKKPDKPTRSYSKFKKNRVDQMVKDHEELKRQMERAYPGFRFLDAEVRYNGINAAFYIYARMVRAGQKVHKKCTDDGRRGKGGRGG